MKCFIRYGASIPLSDDSDPVDLFVENAVQIVSLWTAQHLGDRFENSVGVVAFELIEPLFHKRK
jgi:hypothetical protein